MHAGFIYNGFTEIGNYAMNAMFGVIVVVQVLSALVIVGLVLLQHGKGADMGAAFGSGASGSLFGATGSSSFLTKSTAVAASLFFASTLALAYIGTNRHAANTVNLLDVPASASNASASASASAPVLPAASAPATPAASAPVAAAASAPAAAPAAASAPAPVATGASAAASAK